MVDHIRGKTSLNVASGAILPSFQMAETWSNLNTKPAPQEGQSIHAQEPDSCLVPNASNPVGSVQSNLRFSTESRKRLLDQIRSFHLHHGTAYPRPSHQPTKSIHLEGVRLRQGVRAARAPVAALHHISHSLGAAVAHHLPVAIEEFLRVVQGHTMGRGWRDRHGM